MSQHVPVRLMGMEVWCWHLLVGGGTLRWGFILRSLDKLLPWGDSLWVVKQEEINRALHWGGVRARTTRWHQEKKTENVQKSRRSGAAASPDLNEPSSSLVSPQFSVCRAGGKTQLLWVTLGGRWPEAGPHSHPWPAGRKETRVRHIQLSEAHNHNLN